MLKVQLKTSFGKDTAMIKSEMTPEEKTKAIEKYKCGIGTPTIARQLGVKDTAIRRLIKENGLYRTFSEAFQQPQKTAHKRGQVIL